MKTKLLKGDVLEFTSVNDDDVCAWFNDKWETFILMLNGKVIVSTKNFKSFQDKLNNLIVK